jgi:hypothetical protein
MKKSEVNKLKKAVLSGKRLIDICREDHYDINSLRRVLKKEGIDYRRIISERKEKRSEMEFDKCLKLARKKGFIPSGKDFAGIGIPKGRVGIYLKKLKAIGFVQRNIRQSKILDVELLKELYRIYKKTGNIPENRHVIMYSRFSNTSYYNHFGTLANAVSQMLECYPDAKKENTKFAQSKALGTIKQG